MATLSITTVSLSSPDPGMAAADAGGDQFLGTKRTAFVVYNGDASAKEVTIASQVSDTPGVTSDDVVVSVPAGEMRVFPLASYFNKFQDSNDYVQVTYDAVTSLEVAAIELDR